MIFMLYRVRLVPRSSGTQWKTCSGFDVPGRGGQASGSDCNLKSEGRINLASGTGPEHPKVLDVRDAESFFRKAGRMRVEADIRSLAEHLV